jgi:hypothetical protein
MVRRWLLIAIAVVVLLLVGADLVLRSVAERWVGQRLKQQFSLTEPPSVSLSGFPFLLHLAEGRFSSATVTGSGPQTDAVSFDSVTLTLSDLSFSSGALLSGKSSTIRAASGSGTATLTADQVAAALQARGVDITVTLQNGTVRVHSSALKKDITADLSLSSSGMTLVARSTDPKVPLTLAVPLPAFVSGLRYTKVTVTGSTVVLEFRLDHPSIGVG